jgi:hypothetical protein
LVVEFEHEVKIGRVGSIDFDVVVRAEAFGLELVMPVAVALLPNGHRGFDCHVVVVQILLEFGDAHSGGDGRTDGAGGRSLGTILHNKF